MSALRYGPDREIRWTERRSNARVQTNDAAFLQVLNPLSTDRVEVRVLDVSEHGFKLLVEQFLQRGTTVQVRLKESIAKGDVRYCVPVKEGFHVGVYIEDVFPIPRTNDAAGDTA